jgi:hypothetical protein
MVMAGLSGTRPSNTFTLEKTGPTMAASCGARLPFEGASGGLYVDIQGHDYCA